MADSPDHYKILQVDSEADPEVIQAAYRRLAQKFHPDLASGPEAAARMVAINAAWHVLSDAGRRAAFDRERAAAGPGAAVVGGPDAAGPDDGRRRRGPAVASPGSAAAAPGRAAPRPFGATSTATGPGSAQSPRPESVSRDWSSGRSSVGGGYDPRTMRAAEGHGAAGPPPGNPSGSALNFGRYAGWSLGEIARSDLEYLEWLDRVPIGRAHRDEIDSLLRRAGRRRSARPDEGDRRGLFRRR